MQIDQYIEILKNAQCLPEKDVYRVCEKVKEILFEEPNILDLVSPITVCGDIHGQFYDLLQIFQIGGQMPETNYIFTGNYVNRGYNSVETFQLLMCLKLKYPKQITLLRGNHELEYTTNYYGLYEEVQNKYGNQNVWKFFVDVFPFLPIGAVVDGNVLCIHGGLCPQFDTIDSIRQADRLDNFLVSGSLGDMLESCPDDVAEWELQRKSGFIFRSKQTKEFLHKNSLNLIVRSHQLVMDGYKYWFDKKTLISIWSAPNYVNRCENYAAILELGKENNIHKFKETPENLNNANHKCFPKI